MAKLLTPFTPLNLNERERIFFHVKYEKLGYLCEVCGILGHNQEECGDGVHGVEEIEYDDWMTP